MLSIVTWWFHQPTEVQAAIIGAGATFSAAIFGVLAVIAQMRSQGSQSRATILEGERRRVNAALYEDAVNVCRELADSAITLSTKLRTMSLEIEVAARAEAAHLSYNLPAARSQNILTFYDDFSDAASRFIFLVEHRRIIDPRILIFRTAISVVLHDSRQLMYSDFIMHIMPNLPAEKPDGSLYPYTPPSIDRALALSVYSQRLIEVLSDAIAYTDDFLTEMQNALLGDLFGTKLHPRQPIDPSRRAITLEHAEELESWFLTSSAWGVTITKAEADAKRRFMDAKTLAKIDETERY